MRVRGGGGGFLRKGEIAALSLKALTFCVRVCVCVTGVCTMRPTPCSIPGPLWAPRSSLGERGNDTFVASDQRRGSSHSLSVGSGSRVGGVGKVREEGRMCGAQSLHSFCWFDHKQLISIAHFDSTGRREDVVHDPHTEHTNSERPG